MNVLKLVKLLPEVLQKGKLVANPEAWKSGQITVSLLAGFLGAVVAASSALGYDLPLAQEDLLSVSAGALAVFGVFNPVATIASSDKVGIPTSNN